MAKRALVIRSDYDSLPGVHNSAACTTSLLQSRGFEIVPCLGADATRRGILCAYDQLIAQTCAGDAAVIYYTGHGGLVTNTEHAHDAALPRNIQHICPSDFAETTDGDFRGIGALELSLQLAALTSKTTNATVILECCFSAQMSRGDEPGDAPVTPPTLTRAGLTKYLEAVRERAAGFEPLVLTGNPDAVRVAASGQTEQARWVGLPPVEQLRPLGIELTPHDSWIGAMTLGLSQILGELGKARVSWRSIAPELRARLRVQRPELEGPISRVPFTLATVDATTFAVRRDGDAALVEAGRLLGVSVGDVYGIVPPGAQGSDPAARIATLTIDQVCATHSRATRIAWKNGHGELPPGAAAVALTLALERYPVRIVAPAPERALIEAALQTSGRVRAATTEEQDPLAELHLAPSGLVLRDAEGPLFPPARFPEGLACAVLDVANLATERRLRALGDDGGLAPTDVSVELGLVGPDRTFRRIADHGEALGLGNTIALRLTNHTEANLFANVFNLGLRRRIALLSATAASGVELPPGTEVLIGEAPDGTLAGFPLSWPQGLPDDRPRLDTIMVMITAAETDLRVLESESHLARSSSALTPMQQLLAQLASGQPRGRGDGADLSPERFAIHWRDYRLFPLPASLDLGAPEVDASPPGTGAAVTRAPASLRVRLEAIERRGATTRVDVLVCARSAGSPFCATTLFPGDPTTPVVWTGDSHGPIDVYVWTSQLAADRRPLAELLRAPSLDTAVAALQAPDDDPRSLLAAGASLLLAATARRALAALAPELATAFRGSFGTNDLGARRYATAATSFTLVIEAAG